MWRVTRLAKAKPSSTSRTCSTRIRCPGAGSDMTTLSAALSRPGSGSGSKTRGSTLFRPGGERSSERPFMRFGESILFALALCVTAAPLQAQPQAPRRAPAIGPVDTELYHTRYIRLGQDAGGLLYEPNNLGPKARIALVLSHPMANNFNDQAGRELAGRGYRVLLIDYHGDDLAPEALPEKYLPSISRGIGYLRTVPGVQRVLVIGHSGGGA